MKYVFYDKITGKVMSRERTVFHFEKILAVLKDPEKIKEKIEKEYYSQDCGGTPFLKSELFIYKILEVEDLDVGCKE